MPGNNVLVPIAQAGPSGEPEHYLRDAVETTTRALFDVLPDITVYQEEEEEKRISLSVTVVRRRACQQSFQPTTTSEDKDGDMHRRLATITAPGVV